MRRKLFFSSAGVWRGEEAVRQLLIVVEGFAFIALLLSAILLGVYAVGRMALAVTRFLPMIGKRHRHDDWDKLNRTR
jgi:hypothetical protein